ITVPLMLRAIGALIFRTFTDRYGDKWSMIMDLVLITVLELASNFCYTLP
ncbi:hypothetical protein BGW36DRAFT_297913, partial [Talaromyces proteolyticus]